MPLLGDVMVGKDVIFSPSRKTHPFLSLPIPQLSLSLILLATDYSHGKITWKNHHWFENCYEKSNIKNAFCFTYFQSFFLTEKILEDFESIDMTTIEENVKPQFTTKSSQDNIEKVFSNPYSDNDRYYLILRQSPLKYFMFQRPQVSTE